jgi:hypothetical protein
MTKISYSYTRLPPIPYLQSVVYWSQLVQETIFKFAGILLNTKPLTTEINHRRNSYTIEIGK